ncbi:type II toxin-antitoxin system HicB family antitoxin [Monashia sp. NPDC004114]
MSRPVHEVHAVKHEQWWLVTSPDAPGAVSQVRSVSHAEEHAREAIAFVLDVPEDSFDITLVIELPGPLEGEVKAAKDAIAELAELQKRTAELSRTAARHLAEAGLKGVEVAKVLDVSPQRVSQLIPTGPAKPARAMPAKTVKRSTVAKATVRKGAEGAMHSKATTRAALPRSASSRTASGNSVGARPASSKQRPAPPPSGV